jgi:HPr kinase/phosphorylase
MGHDPAKDFNDRLIAYMTQQSETPSRTLRLDPERDRPEEDRS